MRDIHQQPGPEKYPAKDSPPPFDAPLPVDNTRLQLIYQLLKFEVKLFLDGASDVVFSGLAVGAVILGLIRGGADADRPLREVMSLGRRAEHWINLYGGNHSSASADAAIAPFERKLAAHLERTGVTDRADRALGALDNLVRAGEAAARRSLTAPPATAAPSPTASATASIAASAANPANPPTVTPVQPVKPAPPLPPGAAS